MKNKYTRKSRQLSTSSPGGDNAASRKETVKTVKIHGAKPALVPIFCWKIKLPSPDGAALLFLARSESQITQSLPAAQLWRKKISSSARRFRGQPCLTTHRSTLLALNFQPSAESARSIFCVKNAGRALSRETGGGHRHEIAGKLMRVRESGGTSGEMISINAGERRLLRRTQLPAIPTLRAGADFVKIVTQTGVNTRDSQSPK